MREGTEVTCKQIKTYHILSIDIPDHDENTPIIMSVNAYNNYSFRVGKKKSPQIF